MRPAERDLLEEEDLDETRDAGRIPLEYSQQGVLSETVDFLQLRHIRVEGVKRRGARPAAERP